MVQPQLFDQAYDLPRGGGGVEVGARTASSILTKATGAIERFCDYSLNPYVGCAFGCAYCYAAFFVPDERRAREWGEWVDVKVNALALLRRRAAEIAGKSILVGSATDPYQPIEMKTGLTRSLLDFLSRLSPQPKVHVQTRSPCVVRDADLFGRFDELSVGVSVTTDSEEIRRRFEPKCASIERRLRAAESLVRDGVRVILSVAPMLPMKDPEAFARRLAAVGAHSVWASRFRPTRGDFMAGTRPLALTLAKDLGWDEEAYHTSLRRMRTILPAMKG